MDFYSIISYINSSALQETLFPVKVLFITVSVLFICFIIWSLYKTEWLKNYILFDIVEFLTMRPYGIKKVSRIWNQTIEKVQTNNQAEYKPAIIKINKILNDILKKSDNEGKDLEERLSKFNEDSFPPLLQILESNKICKEMISNPNYELDIEEAKKMLKAYKEAFECLHAF